MTVDDAASGAAPAAAATRDEEDERAASGAAPAATTRDDKDERVASGAAPAVAATRDEEDERAASGAAPAAAATRDEEDERAASGAAPAAAATRDEVGEGAGGAASGADGEDDEIEIVRVVPSSRFRACVRALMRTALAPPRAVAVAPPLPPARRREASFNDLPVELLHRIMPIGVISKARFACVNKACKALVAATHPDPASLATFADIVHEIGVDRVENEDGLLHKCFAKMRKLLIDPNRMGLHELSHRKTDRTYMAGSGGGRRFVAKFSERVNIDAQPVKRSIVVVVERVRTMGALVAVLEDWRVLVQGHYTVHVSRGGLTCSPFVLTATLGRGTGTDEECARVMHEFLYLCKNYPAMAERGLSGVTIKARNIRRHFHPAKFAEGELREVARAT